MSATEVLRLELAGETLEIEQLADLPALAKRSVLSGDDQHWAFLWPSARALTVVVADLGDLSGKTVLELGCGLGVAGLTAARRGAQVTLSDMRPEAMALAKKNASRNGLTVATEQLDWNQPTALGRFDLILASDVFYEDGMLRGVLRFLRDHLAEEGVALVADPKRVQPGGVAGAARLNGLDTQVLELVAGEMLTGGVSLYQLRRKISSFSRSPR